MLSLRGLTKRRGARTVVDRLTLDVRPGEVTGFLGPNGAGKSSTMRMVLGLDHPTAGTARVNGRDCRELDCPVREIGALLDAGAVHPGRRARDHLLAMARAGGVAKHRVDAVLARVGLADVGAKRAGEFSLGMRQRLGIAGALLGEPETLMLDEPVNGLDPDGVRWVRDLVRSLADEGRTVFVSSHLMSEVQLVADRVVLLGQGRLIADAPTSEVVGSAAGTVVVVRSPDTELLARRVEAAGSEHGVSVGRGDAGELRVSGAAPETVGDIAHAAGARIHALYGEEASLEQAYMELTESVTEHTASPPAPSGQASGQEGGR
ncbi:ABC-2 type transport system ATP-binding protein [Haloactinospora alba]|uniref:ABC-2 type transport system ATP-binding protein n=1 Tax=Haloactinospora alba TaxID=405555 RepID=A0A543NN73_9ACTN|nr:ATP-binding cassette domain-containing protein [Haloactinospora alba]TQN33280.1 ABC-2 type transport system ATP-binding protein [Haloactinospora alba]